MSEETQITHSGPVDTEELSLEPKMPTEAAEPGPESTEETPTEQAPTEPQTNASDLIEKPKRPKPDGPRVMAILKTDKGEIIRLYGDDIPSIKEAVKEYPGKWLQEVWYGKRLKLETKVDFKRRA